MGSVKPTTFKKNRIISDGVRIAYTIAYHHRWSDIWTISDAVAPIYRLVFPWEFVNACTQSADVGQQHRYKTWSLQVMFKAAPSCYKFWRTVVTFLGMLCNHSKLTMTRLPKEMNEFVVLLLYEIILFFEKITLHHFERYQKRVHIHIWRT